MYVLQVNQNKKKYPREQWITEKKITLTGAFHLFPADRFLSRGNELSDAYRGFCRGQRFTSPFIQREVLFGNSMCDLRPSRIQSRKNGNGGIKGKKGKKRTVRQAGSFINDTGHHDGVTEQANHLVIKRS